MRKQKPQTVHWTTFAGLFLTLIGTIAGILTLMQNMPSQSAPSPTPTPYVREVQHTVMPAESLAVSPVPNVAPSSDESIYSTIACGMIRVTGGGILNQVRASPMQSSPLVTPVDQGERVSVVMRQETDGILWLRITYGENRIGWIKSEYVVPVSDCSS